jgi:hypothetical protein
MDKRKIYGLMLLFFVLTLDIQAQMLDGKITDTEGNPVPNAAIYIREITQGIAANTKGEFQIKLKNGNYTLEFSSLGYEKKILPVTVNQPLIVIAVQLNEKVYELEEVIISANKEDLAYAIMRKAISMAPFYLHQVKRYESEIYLKGNLQLDKAPRIIESQSPEIKAIKGSFFLEESHNEVIFTAPDNYEQKVVAMTSSFPKIIRDKFNSMPLQTTNIYNPAALGVSPLAPVAFSYYKFTFEGKSTEGEHIINKIRVEPKKNNPQLISGWIYIINDSWNVQNINISQSVFGITTWFTVNYSEVKPSVFLPVAYDMDVTINLLGFKGELKYYSSIKYKSIELNESQKNILADVRIEIMEDTLKSGENIDISKDTLKKYPVLPKIIKTEKQLKAERELETLYSKENFSNRDAYKMANLMQKATETEESKKKRKSLELSAQSNVNVIVDSLAKVRDSLYWAKIRSSPLQDNEIISYKNKDSMDRKLSDSTKKSLSFGKIMLGDRAKIGEKYWLDYAGLLGSVPEYNFVDGVWLGQKFTFGKNLTKAQSLSISPSVHYVTARKTVNWQLEGRYRYAPLKNGTLILSGGNTTVDFQHDGNSRLLNSLFSLYYAENIVKLFQNEFISIFNKIDVANGLVLGTNISYANRNALENRISYNFLHNEPSPNLPNAQSDSMPMPDNSLTKLAVQLEYTPRYHYRIRNGRKSYAYSNFPTFRLSYAKGISTNDSNSASFDKLELSIRQDVKLNFFDRLNYSVNAGTFLSSKRMYFPDYKHFYSNELFLTENSLTNSFCIQNYSYSTDKRWIQAHLNYTSAYLFIKNLPFLQKYMFDESLHARTLWIPRRNYTEFGYSVGFANMIGAGVFVGFNNGKYNAVGFILSFPILKMTK